MPDTESASSKIIVGIIPTVFQDPGSQPVSHQEASGSASKPRADADSKSAEANKAPADPAASKTSTYKPPTKYRFIKDYWGDRKNFQYSHGLRMEPDDFEEGELILEGYIECERLEHGDLAWEDRKVINMEPRDKTSSPSRATR